VTSVYITVIYNTLLIFKKMFLFFQTKTLSAENSSFGSRSIVQNDPVLNVHVRNCAKYKIHSVHYKYVRPFVLKLYYIIKKRRICVFITYHKKIIVFIFVQEHEYIYIYTFFLNLITCKAYTCRNILYTFF